MAFKPPQSFTFSEPTSWPAWRDRLSRFRLATKLHKEDQEIQVYAMFAPHSNMDSLKGSDIKVKEPTYGWFCHTGSSLDWDTSKSGASWAPKLQLFGFIVDFIPIIAGCFALENYSRPKRKKFAENNATLGVFGGFFLKGGGCVWWLCLSSTNMHGWCCLASFISMLFNFFSAYAQREL